MAMETNPFSALEKISTQRVLFPKLLQSINSIDLDKQVSCPIYYDINSLKEAIYDKDRFSHVTVLVIDQNMPDLNGIELCEKLIGHPAKKIILTNEQNDKLVIEAFNNGIIDYFIPKDEPNLIKHLTAAVTNLQQAYFHEVSIPLISAIKKQDKSFLNSDYFIAELNRFIKKNNIYELYLLDINGSYLGISNNSDAYAFLVKNDEQITSLLEIAADFPVDQNFLNKIKNKEQLLYFFNSDEENASPCDWQPLAYEIYKNIDCFSIATIKLKNHKF